MRSSNVRSENVCVPRHWVVAIVGCVCGAAASDPVRTSLCTSVGQWDGMVEETEYSATVVIDEKRSGVISFGALGDEECIEETYVVEAGNGFSFSARTPIDPRCQGFHGSVQYTQDCEYGTGTFTNGDGSGGRMDWRREPHLTVYRDGLTAYRLWGAGYYDSGSFSYTSTRIAGAFAPSLEDAKDPSQRPNERYIRLVVPPAKQAPQPGGLAQLRFKLDTVDGPVIDHTKRAASFGMSCYVIALEADYGTPPISCKPTRIGGVVYEGTTRDPYGLPGLYCRAFIANVKLQGSARLASGGFVHYEIRPARIVKVAEPPTADGTSLVAGRTVARDPAIVQGRNVAMMLDGIGNVLANDRGGAIKGYRIDLYGGEGEAACRGYANPVVIGACVEPQSGCPGV